MEAKFSEMGQADTTYPDNEEAIKKAVQDFGFDHIVSDIVHTYPHDIFSRKMSYANFQISEEGEQKVFVVYGRNMFDYDRRSEFHDGLWDRMVNLYPQLAPREFVEMDHSVKVESWEITDGSGQISGVGILLTVKKMDWFSTHVRITFVK